MAKPIYFADIDILEPYCVGNDSAFSEVIVTSSLGLTFDVIPSEQELDDFVPWRNNAASGYKAFLCKVPKDETKQIEIEDISIADTDILTPDSKLTVDSKTQLTKCIEKRIVNINLKRERLNDSWSLFGDDNGRSDTFLQNMPPKGANAQLVRATGNWPAALAHELGTSIVARLNVALIIEPNIKYFILMLPEQLENNALVLTSGSYSFEDFPQAAQGHFVTSYGVNSDIEYQMLAEQIVAKNPETASKSLLDINTYQYRLNSDLAFQGEDWSQLLLLKSSVLFDVSDWIVFWSTKIDLTTEVTGLKNKEKLHALSRLWFTQTVNAGHICGPDGDNLIGFYLGLDNKGSVIDDITKNVKTMVEDKHWNAAIGTIASGLFDTFWLLRSKEDLVDVQPQTIQQQTQLFVDYFANPENLLTALKSFWEMIYDEKLSQADPIDYLGEQKRLLMKLHETLSSEEENAAAVKQRITFSLLKDAEYLRKELSKLPEQNELDAAIITAVTNALISFTDDLMCSVGFAKDEYMVDLARWCSINVKNYLSSQLFPSTSDDHTLDAESLPAPITIRIDNKLTDGGDEQSLSQDPDHGVRLQGMVTWVKRADSDFVCLNQASVFIKDDDAFHALTLMGGGNNFLFPQPYTYQNGIRDFLITYEGLSSNPWGGYDIDNNSSSSLISEIPQQMMDVVTEDIIWPLSNVLPPRLIYGESYTFAAMAVSNAAGLAPVMNVQGNPLEPKFTLDTTNIGEVSIPYVRKVRLSEVGLQLTQVDEMTIEKYGSIALPENVHPIYAEIPPATRSCTLDSGFAGFNKVTFFSGAEQDGQPIGKLNWKFSANRPQRLLFRALAINQGRLIDSVSVLKFTLQGEMENELQGSIEKDLKITVTSSHTSFEVDGEERHFDNREVTQFDVWMYCYQHGQERKPTFDLTIVKAGEADNIIALPIPYEQSNGLEWRNVSCRVELIGDQGRISLSRPVAITDTGTETETGADKPDLYLMSSAPDPQQSKTVQVPNSLTFDIQEPRTAFETWLRWQSLGELDDYSALVHSQAYSAFQQATRIDGKTVDPIISDAVTQGTLDQIKDLVAYQARIGVVDVPVKTIFESYFGLTAMEKPERSKLEPAIEDFYVVEVLCLFNRNNVSHHKLRCKIDNGVDKKQLALFTVKDLTAPRQNGNRIELPDTGIWQIMIYSAVDKAYFHDGSAKFVETMAAHRPVWTGKRNNTDLSESDFVLFNPARLVIEQVNIRAMNELATILFESVSVDIDQEAEKIFVNLDKGEVTEFNNYLDVYSARVYRQQYHWDGYYMPENEIIDSNCLSQFPYTHAVDSQIDVVKLIHKWENKAFESSKVDSLSEQQRPKRLPINRQVMRLDSFDISGEKRSTFYRFAVEFENRYAPLFNKVQNQRVVAHQTDTTGKSLSELYYAKGIKNGLWKRALSRFRGIPEVPRPRVRAVIPLTRNLINAKDNKLPNLLVVVDEPWFAISGLNENLLSDIALVPGNDTDDKKAIYENVGDPLQGPDPILHKTGFGGLGSKESVPITGNNDSKGLINIKVSGPAGLTRDVSASRPNIAHSAFFIEPVLNEQHPLYVADPEGLVNQMDWALLKLQFARELHADGLINSSESLISEWTQAQWHQLVPDNDLVTEIAQDTNTREITHIRKDLTNATAICQVTAEQSDHLIVYIGQDKLDLNKVVYQENATLGLCHWLVITEQVFDAGGGSSQERVEGIFRLNNSVLVNVFDEDAKVSVPIAEDTNWFVRVLQIQYVKKALKYNNISEFEEIKFEHLFPDQGKQMKSDASARVISCSSPIFLVKKSFS
jgi:hypothetical protein